MKLGYKDDLKSRIIAIVLACLGFTGIAGLHRFYKGQILMGILYLLTFGLFFFGTFIDLIFLVTNLISFIKSNAKTKNDSTNNPIERIYVYCKRL
ncbi:MAG: TM2 domain-containing protein [Ruminococcus flavefaciens]|nr:TM2 domain-containing protein [Ruminococcus flavefaciens]